MRKNILKEKSFDFAVRIVDLTKKLNKDKEYVISRQLLRNGTTVDALLREAEFGESKADFAHKMNIALKEANESVYWFDLLVASDILDIKTIHVEKELAKELVAILVSTLKTVRK